MHIYLCDGASHGRRCNQKHRDRNRVKSLNKRAKIYSPGITKATHKCLRLLVNLSLDSTGRISSVLTPRLRTGKARGREQKLILGDTRWVLSDAHSGQMIQANQTKGGLCFNKHEVNVNIINDGYDSGMCVCVCVRPGFPSGISDGKFE